jgi:hypothetical protein
VLVFHGNNLDKTKMNVKAATPATAES